MEYRNTVTPLPQVVGVYQATTLTSFIVRISSRMKIENQVTALRPERCHAVARVVARPVAQAATRHVNGPAMYVLNK